MYSICILQYCVTENGVLLNNPFLHLLGLSIAMLKGKPFNFSLYIYICLATYASLYDFYCYFLIKFIYSAC